MTKRRGKSGKFGPQKKTRNMAKIQCYGCQEYGNYKKYCPKPKKDNKKEVEKKPISPKKWRKLKIGSSSKRK